MKTREKKVWDLYMMFRNSLIFAVGGVITLLVLASIFVYLGGLWVGISFLLGSLVGDVVFHREYFRKKRLLNPIDRAYIMFPSFEHKKDVEFYKEVDEYMRRTTPARNPFVLRLPLYGILILLTILFLHGQSLNLPTVVVLGIASFLASFGASGGWIMTMIEWRAKDPRKISKFFGVPIAKWKPDLKPVPRPSSITGLMLLFFGLGVFGIVLAPASLIGKILNIRLIFPLENTTMLVILSGGAALIGGFCLWAGLGLRKMMKEGAGIAMMMCFFPLFLGIIAFVAAPLAGQGVLPEYHALWVFGVPLSVIYIIKRNWRKFKG